MISCSKENFFLHITDSKRQSRVQRLFVNFFRYISRYCVLYRKILKHPFAFWKKRKAQRYSRSVEFIYRSFARISLARSNAEWQQKRERVAFCRRYSAIRRGAGTRKFFVSVRPRYRKGRSMRRDLCDWFERSGVTVQGSALSPGVSAPSGIHLPSKRRCPKDLYKFACRILAEILTNGRCGGWPVASVVARFVSVSSSSSSSTLPPALPQTPALPNFILTRPRSRRFTGEIWEATETARANHSLLVDLSVLSHAWENYVDCIRVVHVPVNANHPRKMRCEIYMLES